MTSGTPPVVTSTTTTGEVLSVSILGPLFALADPDVQFFLAAGRKRGSANREFGQQPFSVAIQSAQAALAQKLQQQAQPAGPNKPQPPLAEGPDVKPTPTQMPQQVNDPLWEQIMNAVRGRRTGSGGTGEQPMPPPQEGPKRPTGPGMGGLSVPALPNEGKGDQPLKPKVN